ncbi:MAG: hypothetical protein QXV46_04605 [Candidatus Bathyarchaeia archaeon]|nr:hypothetical protein [Candidatus Bathyarchaeota archaeon]
MYGTYYGYNYPQIGGYPYPYCWYSGLGYGYTPQPYCQYPYPFSQAYDLMRLQYEQAQYPFYPTIIGYQQLYRSLPMLPQY